MMLVAKISGTKPVGTSNSVLKHPHTNTATFFSSKGTDKVEFRQAKGVRSMRPGTFAVAEIAPVFSVNLMGDSGKRFRRAQTHKTMKR